MSSNKLKDIGLKLNNDSIFDIISYKDNELHPILQAAITLIFFTQDEAFRSEYNGLYHLLGQSNNNIINDLELDLAHMSFAITSALQQTYPEVVKTELIPVIDNSSLTIDINITTDVDLLTTTIYTRDL